MRNKQRIIQNIPLSFLDSEEESSHTFLFLHGWGLSKEIFQELFPFFSEFRVVALDFPGFGKTPLPQNGLTLQGYADILEEFLQKEHIEKYTLIGHSFSGRVSMLHESQHKKAHSLVLLSSGGILNTSFKVRFLKKLSLLKNLFPSKKIEQWWYRYIVREEDALTALSSLDMKKTFQKIVGTDCLPFAEKISCKTLILWGKEDTVTPLSHAKKFHHAIKNSVLKTHSGSHHVFLEYPSWVQEEIKNFCVS
jgi:pimeloyl-ACP methyl ester carboxylesterase